ncbi:hypothetical protein LTR78_007748 [Recurvomyces mirabilis]|uniref:Glutathione S-transferase n=1 Tax=Recurvomyces mirabilis TaxID=574656 RepID=A0AAE0TU16_9PEZI|nr:hypothetical protein LTR78_007748 [Recurvomyces mirabilis]KAK5151636.1 hypothetical protein LTS14_009123 [Recurvomyces mirabilis]
MSSLALYHRDGACSMAPHIRLLHLPIPFTAVPMIDGPDGYQAADGSFSHADYRKISPAGFVPALVVDGQALTDNAAMLTYLAGLRQDEGLGGSDEWERAKIGEWLAWLAGTLHGRGFGGLWRPGRYSDDETMWPSIEAKARGFILECFARIEAGIGGKPYAVGERLTVVDIMLHTFWRWSRALSLSQEDMVARYPGWAKVMAKVEKLDSVRSAMAAEGQELCFT